MLNFIIIFLGILILGGFNPSAANSMELYFPLAHDPGQNRLLEQRMIEGRGSHFSVLMADGRVLTAGGFYGGLCLSSTELFDPVSGRVTRGPNMSIARARAAAALIGQDICVASGYYSGLFLNNCERFRSGEWTPIASMNGKRRGFAMVAVGGKLFIFGGEDGRRNLSSVECYDPKRDRWQIVRQMPTVRSRLAAAELNGSIYVCGGWDRHDSLSICERFDPRRQKWEPVASMRKERADFALVATNGRLYAVGGWGSDDSEKTVEMYNPDRNKWTLLRNELKQGRWRCSAVAL